jgi:hypothetical protein
LFAHDLVSLIQRAGGKIKDLESAVTDASELRQAITESGSARALAATFNGLKIARGSSASENPMDTWLSEKVVSLKEAETLRGKVDELGGMEAVARRLSDTKALDDRLKALGGMKAVESGLSDTKALETKVKALGGMDTVTSRLSDAEALKSRVDALGGVGEIELRHADSQQLLRKVNKWGGLDKADLEWQYTENPGSGARRNICHSRGEDSERQDGCRGWASVDP